MAAQAGTLVIYTRFEHHKLKIVDFGVVYLKVFSKDGRIVVTESAFYGKPYLAEARVKWTDIVELKRALGVMRCE